ncbi:MAG TPA: hypothetical protein VEQ37_14220, partial [Actinomycetota bacterium]|nr:hypothetical protein [Actinomycetota bacterium]
MLSLHVDIGELDVPANHGKGRVAEELLKGEHVAAGQDELLRPCVCRSVWGEHRTPSMPTARPEWAIVMCAAHLLMRRPSRVMKNGSPGRRSSTTLRYRRRAWAAAVPNGTWRPFPPLPMTRITFS